MSNVLTKPISRLKVHFENKSTENRKLFRTTENIKVNNEHQAMEILSEMLGPNPDKRVKKAWYNGKEIKLPQ